MREVVLAVMLVLAAVAAVSRAALLPLGMASLIAALALEGQTTTAP